MPVDASSLTKLSRQLLLSSLQAPKTLEAAAKSGQPIAKREMSRAIAGRYNLTPARIKSGVRVNGTGRFAFEISGSDRPIMVNRGYRATQNKTGLRYAIERGAPVVLTTGFISKKKKYALQRLGPSRLPIRPVTGPGIGTILENQQFIREPVRTIIAGLTDRVTTQLERVINRG